MNMLGRRSKPGLPAFVLPFDAKMRRPHGGPDHRADLDHHAVEPKLCGQQVQFLLRHNSRVKERGGKHITRDTRNTFQKQSFTHVEIFV